MFHSVDILSLVYKTLLDIESLVLIVLTGYAVTFAKTHFNAKQLEIAKEIAATVVTATKGISGALGINLEDEMKGLVDKAKVYAKAHGINYTDEQWEGFIREAHDIIVGALKQLETSNSSNPTV